MPNPTPTAAQRRFAIGMLLIATLFWGMGFAWAKNVGELANRAAGETGHSAFGPMLMLTLRFLAAAGLWVLIFPQSRRGWTSASLRRGAMLGVWIWLGLALQHLGLDRSSEATTAFLTNLTVVIVPLLVAIGNLRLPLPPQIAAFTLALAGIYLLTGAETSGFGPGEWLGAGCAVAFSIELLLLNVLLPRDSVYRLTLAMFVFCGLASGAVAIATPAFWRVDVAQLATADVGVQLLLLTTLTTCAAFGLMTRYQPVIDPSRAAIVYLFEPIFAAGFAWITEPNAAMTRTALFGAGLIVLANVLAELQWRRASLLIWLRRRNDGR